MKHPEVLLVPVLMLADYALTVLGARRSEEGYRRHFKSEHYELNPVWQKSVALKSWFNLRHMLLTLLVSAALVFTVESGMPDAMREGLLGCLLTVFGAVVGRHFSNLLLFRRLTRHPDEIAGEVTLSHPLVLRISLYQFLALAMPVGLLAFVARTAFTLGALLGALLVLVLHAVWIRRAQKQRAVAVPGGSTAARPPIDAAGGAR